MIPVLVGLGILLGGTAIVVANWDSIKDWLRDFIPRLRQAWATIREHIPHEARIFGDWVDRVVAIIHKLFYQEDCQWYEEKTTRKISEDEVPAAILNKIKRNQETDITETIERELSLEV